MFWRKRKVTNHHYLFIKNVSLKQIKIDIDEINHRLFYNKLQIKYLIAPNTWDKKNYDVIHIRMNEDDLGMWFNEDGVLEIRNQGNSGFAWVGYIIETELSVKYDALKGDEGVGNETWKGDITKYNTYEKYLLMLNKTPSESRLRWAKNMAEYEAKRSGCEAFKDGS